MLWKGRPLVSAYVLRLWLPGALVGAGALVVGIAWERVSLEGHHPPVYALAGVLFFVLALYGLPVRALLLVRLARDCRYSISADEVVLRPGRGERIELPAGDLPPWTLIPSADGSRADIVFVVTPERESFWGIWRLVDKRPRLQCVERAQAEAAAALLAALGERDG